MITATCPDCDNQFKVHPATAGKTARCPKCRGVFTVPAGDADPLPLPVPPPAPPRRPTPPPLSPPVAEEPPPAPPDEAGETSRKQRRDHDEESGRKERPKVSTAVLAVVGGILVFGCLAVSGIVALIASKSRPDSAVNSGPSIDRNEPLAFDGDLPNFINAYEDNQIAADQKYLNKRIRVVMLVTHIGRKDGQAYLGACGVQSFRQLEPNIICFFSKSEEPSIANIKGNGASAPTVEGICRGRIDDGINRDVVGYRFHIKVESCKLIKGP